MEVEEEEEQAAPPPEDVEDWISVTVTAGARGGVGERGRSS